MEPVKRPKRLWLMAIMNTIASATQLVGISALILLSLLSDSFGPMTPDLWLMGLGTIAVALFLLISTWLAFSRYPNSRKLTLIAAALFYGLLLAQFAVIDNPQFDASSKAGRIMRTVLEFAITVWVLYSDKTTRYFADKTNPVAVPMRKD